MLLNLNEFFLFNMTLREQIYQASELNSSNTRLTAVAALKDRMMDRDTALELCDYLRADLHPAERTTVAQVLGFHKAAVRFSYLGAVLHAQAKQETDPIALRALIFALRDFDAVIDLLEHRAEGVAREVVLYAPANTQSLQPFLKASFNGLADRTFEAFCCRLSEFEDIESHVLAFLMTAEFREVGQKFDARVRQVFAEVDQAILFEVLIDVRGELERTYKTIWPGIWQRERQRRLLEQFVQMVGESGVDDALIERVFLRVVSDEKSYGDYVRFVRALLGVLNTKAALAWITACDRLGQKADRALLSRLAETLVTLVKNAPLIVDEAQAVLGKWESQLPGVRMKAFHAAR
ncbi:MAG: hypothetical protein HOH77_15940 [Candidatus Latescibacteria bacterium]|nr:hypothetical protein [Candidatus Latescibacterota bacterium]